MTRKELLSSEEYWLFEIQQNLFEEFEKYMIEKQLNRKQLADQLGFSKGYVSQVLNGNYDHRLSSFVNLALKIGKVPIITFKSLNKVIYEDEQRIHNKNMTNSILTRIGTTNNTLDYSLSTINSTVFYQSH